MLNPIVGLFKNKQTKIGIIEPNALETKTDIDLIDKTNDMKIQKCCKSSHVYRQSLMELTGATMVMHKKTPPSELLLFFECAVSWYTCE